MLSCCYYHSELAFTQQQAKLNTHHLRINFDSSYFNGVIFSILFQNKSYKSLILAYQSLILAYQSIILAYQRPLKVRLWCRTLSAPSRRPSKASSSKPSFSRRSWFLKAFSQGESLCPEFYILISKPSSFDLVSKRFHSRAECDF